ncbi:GLPGLI family protein [Mucilaginibacter angelicae]|uniref:GLPGLI family protein n=1 Tax=Mucilaginibacter angelicae TaxID=869718 RepID=A0ABV6L229_9SPHI
MKRQLIWIVFLLTLSVSVSAQKPDTARIQVHYKFTHLRDTLRRANPYSENVVLFIGSHSSHYASYDRLLENESLKKQMQAQLASSPDGSIRINHKVSGPESEYYQWPGDKKLIRKELLLTSTYVITEALPTINWHILGDTAIFGELHCQKAICHFKGRDYTAWFCPDMPVHVGPWKLNGLPGVIVEAYDSKKEVVFKFDGTEKIVPVISGPGQPADEHLVTLLASFGVDDAGVSPIIIQVPAKAIQTTGKAFIKLQEAMRKDPNAVANIQNYDGPRPVHIYLPVINNPIELPEK